VLAEAAPAEGADSAIDGVPGNPSHPAILHGLKEYGIRHGAGDCGVMAFAGWVVEEIMDHRCPEIIAMRADDAPKNARDTRAVCQEPDWHGDDREAWVTVAEIMRQRQDA
jgi:hypothetical protein